MSLFYAVILLAYIVFLAFVGKARDVVGLGGLMMLAALLSVYLILGAAS